MLFTWLFKYSQTVGEIVTLNGENRYYILGVLGQGGFGTVYKCVSFQDKQQYVLKRNLIESDKPNAFDNAMREVDNLQKLKNPNITMLIEFEADPKLKRIDIIQEYCDCGDLKLVLKQIKFQKLK